MRCIYLAHMHLCTACWCRQISIHDIRLADARARIGICAAKARSHEIMKLWQLFFLLPFIEQIQTEMSVLKDINKTYCKDNGKGSFKRNRCSSTYRYTLHPPPTCRYSACDNKTDAFHFSQRGRFVFCVLPCVRPQTVACVCVAFRACLPPSFHKLLFISQLWCRPTSASSSNTSHITHHLTSLAGTPTPRLVQFVFQQNE